MKETFDKFIFAVNSHPLYLKLSYMQLDIEFARNLSNDIQELIFMFNANTDRLNETKEQLKDQPNDKD